MIDAVTPPQGQAQQAATPVGAAVMRRALKDKTKSGPVISQAAVARMKKTAPPNTPGKRQGGEVDILA